jgi:hypothetical protein
MSVVAKFLTPQLVNKKKDVIEEGTYRKHFHSRLK